ncbi:MAG: carboxypeptidase regulatory-like domain-containing protein [Bacteroides sp.]|nr:carboxypeptidase regulatory-like domain-containing protein [Bacteroides sp.]
MSERLPFETLSDANGYYRLDSVPKGRYAAIAAMPVNEYPRMQQVPLEDMKLEFWVWNVILDNDLTLNIRYDKMELYGTKAFF